MKKKDHPVNKHEQQQQDRKEPHNQPIEVAQRRKKCGTLSSKGGNLKPPFCFSFSIPEEED